MLAEDNANKTHCVNGHEFTLDNTYRRPSGGRTCKKCAYKNNLNSKLRSFKNAQR